MWGEVGNLFRARKYVDEDALDESSGEGGRLLLLEGDGATHGCHERVVARADDVLAGMKLRAALADEDIAFLRDLSAEELDAEALGDGIAAELSRAARFTMGHRGFASLAMGI